MIKKLSMVTRFVSDQNEALAFYRDTLGFEVIRDNEGPHGRFLTVAPTGDDGVELILMTPDGFDDETASNLTDLIGNDAGLIYEVEDCHAVFDKLVEKSVDVLQEPQQMNWGIQAVITDPDGNEIVLQQRPDQR